jgi:hypothetical protein
MRELVTKQLNLLVVGEKEHTNEEATLSSLINTFSVHFLAISDDLSI